MTDPMFGRKLVSVLVLVCLLMTSMPTSLHAAGERAALESLAELIFRETPAGMKVLERITGSTIADRVSDSAFRSFTERLRLSENRVLHRELNAEIRKIDGEFSRYRTEKGRPAKVEAGEVLPADELEFLARAAESLRGNVIENLIFESTTFVAIRKAHYASVRESFLTAPNGTPEGEIPQLPISGGRASAVDIDRTTLTWRGKIAMRFRAYRNFFKAFKLSDGQWKTLFGREGKNFTVRDLVLVRKVNRLMDALNEYAKMRLVIKSFANERPLLYSRLNQATEEATKQFMEGAIGLDEYLSTRASAAQSLKLNEIVAEAEKRMLTALERCRELGGRKIGEKLEKGIIEVSEDNVRAYMGHVKRLSDSLTRMSAELRALKASDPKAPELRRRTLQATADRDLWSQRLDVESKTLEKLYLEYIEHYESLDLFANLRIGRINSEEIRPFDLPEPFSIPKENLGPWADVYDRALFNSTNELVVGETRLFFKTRVGATRSFVNKMNTMTEKYFGKRFTETQFGQEFREYERNLFVNALTKIGKFLGITVPSGLAVTYSDKLWAFIFSDDSTPSPTPESTPGPSTTPGSEDYPVPPPPNPTPTGTPGGGLVLTDEDT